MGEATSPAFDRPDNVLFCTSRPAGMAQIQRVDIHVGSKVSGAPRFSPYQPFAAWPFRPFAVSPSSSHSTICDAKCSSRTSVSIARTARNSSSAPVRFEASTQSVTQTGSHAAQLATFGLLTAALR